MLFILKIDVFLILVMFYYHKTLLLLRDESLVKLSFEPRYIFLQDIDFYPSSISAILIIPNNIPNLLIMEMSSLKNIIPINVKITKFKIVKIEMAFDNISYCRE